MHVTFSTQIISEKSVNYISKIEFENFSFAMGTFNFTIRHLQHFKSRLPLVVILVFVPE